MIKYILLKIEEVKIFFVQGCTIIYTALIPIDVNGYAEIESVKRDCIL